MATDPLHAERRRWLALVLLLIFGLGGGIVSGIVYTSNVQQSQQRDLCDLARAFIPTAAPAPSASYGAAQRAAGQRYLERRC